MKARREKGFSFTLSLTSALDVGGKRYASAALSPGKEIRYPLQGGWMGPRASLDGFGKSRPYRDSIP